MEVSIEVVYKRDDGVTISRTARHARSHYGKGESVAQFKKTARRRAAEALNAVLGTSPEITVTRA